VGRRRGCVWWRAEEPVAASRAWHHMGDGGWWAGAGVGAAGARRAGKSAVIEVGRRLIGSVGCCGSWVFPCSLVKVSRRRRAGMGVAGRSPAVKQVQIPACGGALPSLANLLDSSSTTCKGRTQLGSRPTGSKGARSFGGAMSAFGAEAHLNGVLQVVLRQPADWLQERPPGRKSLARNRASSAYLKEGRSQGSLREQHASNELLRTIDAGRSGSCGALLAAHPAAGICVGAPAGVPIAGGAQRKAAAPRGRGLLPRRAGQRASLATPPIPPAVHETTLARVEPERRPAERRGHQIAARMNGTVGSRP